MKKDLFAHFHDVSSDFKTLCEISKINLNTMTNRSNFENSLKSVQCSKPIFFQEEDLFGHLRC